MRRPWAARRFLLERKQRYDKIERRKLLENRKELQMISDQLFDKIFIYKDVYKRQVYSTLAASFMLPISTIFSNCCNCSIFMDLSVFSNHTQTHAEASYQKSPPYCFGTVPLLRMICGLFTAPGSARNTLHWNRHSSPKSKRYLNFLSL